MNLYYIQGSCALAPHIVAIEAGIPVQAIEVDFPTKTIVPSGADYLSVNPKGYVPALELDDGEVLTEAPVVVQYLADLKPEAKLAPANGTLARAAAGGAQLHLDRDPPGLRAAVQPGGAGRSPRGAVRIPAQALCLAGQAAGRTHLPLRGPVHRRRRAVVRHDALGAGRRA